MTLPQLRLLRLEHYDIATIETSETSTLCVDTRQMSVLATEDICPVSAADICPVSTADIWLLWGHLGMDENDFDPFFTPKMGKMEQI